MEIGTKSLVGGFGQFASDWAEAQKKKQAAAEELSLQKELYKYKTEQDDISYKSKIQQDMESQKIAQTRAGKIDAELQTQKFWQELLKTDEEDYQTKRNLAGVKGEYIGEIVAPLASEDERQKLIKHARAKADAQNVASLQPPTIQPTGNPDYVQITYPKAYPFRGRVRYYMETKIVAAKEVQRDFEMGLATFNAAKGFATKPGVTPTQAMGVAQQLMGMITRRFGTGHNATDYAMPEGTPVTAMSNGVVIGTGYDPNTKTGAGKFLKVKYDNGMTVSYSHLSQFNAKKGDPVQAGATLGLSGRTGNATGPTLHVVVRDSSGKLVNPESVFGSGGGAAEKPLVAKKEEKPKAGAPTEAQALAAWEAIRARMAARATHKGTLDESEYNKYIKQEWNRFPQGYKRALPSKYDAAATASATDAMRQAGAAVSPRTTPSFTQYAEAARRKSNKAKLTADDIKQLKMWYKEDYGK